MTEITRIIEMFQERMDSIGGIITLALDVALIVIVIVLFLRFMKNKLKLSHVSFLAGGILILFGIGYALDLLFFLEVLKYVLFWSFGVLIIIYNQEIRHAFEGYFSSIKTNNVFESKQEKEDVIKVLCASAKQLSEKSVGALITIEREDSLSSFIENAIPIHATITQELITTLFTPGTACHDGAVIIRKDRIMCAGAYLPASDKYDIPKSLGTRHRAAIGVSERYDSITIVVSEETGYISLTVDGVITLDITLERLEEMLDRYLSNK